MPKFYSVSHNTFQNPDLPWIESIADRLDSGRHCKECDGDIYQPSGDLQCLLNRKKGKLWPDVIGCGAYPFFIVSSRVIEDWRNDNLGVFIHNQVVLLPPYPRSLQTNIPPLYFWINGEAIVGARIDFDASGFVDVRYCATCGRRMDNTIETYKRQQSSVWPYKFYDNSWDGKLLFTTDLSPTVFFCTQALVECAIKHQHTNFRFVPVEHTEGAAVKY